MSQERAAARVGIHVRTARDWDHGVRRSRRSRFYPDGRRVNYATGQTTMETMTSPPPGLTRGEQTLDPRFLSLADREQIADLRLAGHGFQAIGRALGRPASTIMREVDRNSVAGRYHPHAAHRLAAARRPRPKPAKLAMAGDLRTYVADRLSAHWSPEQISRTLPQQYPDDEAMRVSPETIYQAIYVQARGGLKRELTVALRSGRTRRKPHRLPEQRTSPVAEPMLIISERPAAVEDRAIPGHWEGDLILGAGNRSAILTLVERSTRYVLLGHLPDGHTAEEVRDILVPLMRTLPEHLRHSLTGDQGGEMAQHRTFTIATNVPVYFCDPASPWQRGSNENTNGLLRQYFPKGTDLAIHSPQDLDHVADQLNTRPRKTLDWETPAQRLHHLIVPA
ncbi:MAG TPA: IS30 family transposase [Thermomicrobiales bacterium]|nr:IS30 family transposase [Thermomicrobiales bacterium]